MKTRIVRIGNSRGIRIPKAFLDQIGLAEEVDLRVENNSLVIQRPNRARAGWATAFQEMAQRGDDALVGEAPPSLTRWDEDEWEWR